MFFIIKNYVIIFTVIRMKVCLFFEKEKALRQSGIGRALKHQKKALSLANVDYTLDYKDEYDIIHINTVFSESYHVLRKARKNEKIIIVHGHSTKEDFANSFRCWRLVRPIFNRMVLKMYKNADIIITPTPYSKKLIEGYKGVNCPVYAVSNGIDLNEYSYSEDKIMAFKEYFNITDQKVVIGVGLFFDRKGIFDFFDVARKMPDVTFIWFGHLSYILTQTRVIKAIKNRPNNVIMPGYIDSDVIKGAFLGANCLFFPSKEETEGIVVLEGLASRIPLVVRNIGVYDPWLVDGQNCLMANSIDGFVEKINYVLNNDLSDVVNRGYETVKERSIEKVGEQLKSIYEKVFQGKK